MRSSASLEFGDAELKIEDIMSETIVSAAPDETVLSAARRMAKHNISCIVVTTADGPVGILTERDALRGVAGGYEDFLTAIVSEKMSSPVITVSPDLPALDASALMESKGIKRLLVVRNEQLVGVVTQTDITRGLISMSPFKNISDLMSTEVVTVNATTTITEAAQLMASRNISCVVLMHRQEAAGIVTEKDVLQRVVAGTEDPTTTPVAEIMSFPVATVPPTYSVMSATRMMDSMHIHRLVVAQDDEVQGIVTQTDIIGAVRRKLEEARAARVQRQSERSRLSESAMETLASIQGLVGAARIPGAGPAATAAILQDIEAHTSQLQDSLQSLARII
jgi:CBS domain-containing protein